MLIFDGNSFTIDGVTVFSDHADPDQFWYLPPSAPQLARRGPQDLPNFSLVTYRPADAAESDTLPGGGFLMFESVLPLTEDTRRKVISRAQMFANGTVKLSPVPLDSGTVKVVALDLEGSGGTLNTAAGTGLTFVESIMGATKPSMSGDNNALFNLGLSGEGAVLLKRIFEEGASNVGVIYDFTYTGLRPALQVEITANFKRLYDHFSMSFGVDGGVNINGFAINLDVDIDLAFEELVQTGAIEIKVINFADAADRAQKETWALEFFKNNLLKDWFEPTLGLPRPAGADGGGSGTPDPANLLSGVVSGAAGALGGAVTEDGFSVLDAAARAGGGGTGGDARGDDAGGDADAGGDTDADAGGGGATGGGTGGAGGAGAGGDTATGGAGNDRTGDTGGETGGDTGGDAGGDSGGDGDNDRSGGGDGDRDSGGGDEGSGGAGGPSIANVTLAFKLKKVELIEDKSVTLKYNRQEAVQRSHLPQGPLTTLAGGLSGAPFFVDVDLDDPFFRTIDITVSNPTDFTRIGLLKADIALEYGRPAIPAEVRREEVSFTAGQTQGDATHSFFVNDALDLDFRVERQFHFDPAAGWEAQSLSYTLPVETTRDTTLLVLPERHFGFVEIGVLPGTMDPVLMRHTEVTLSFDDGSWQTERSFIVAPGAAEQRWRLRSENPDAEGVGYRLTHHLADGTVTPGESGVTKARKLIVNDPFRNPIEITFVPNFDTSALRQVFVEATYEDPDNNYRRTEMLTFDAGNAAQQTLRIARFDNGPTEVSLRATALGQDNSITRHITITTEETLVFLTQLLV